MKKLNLRKVLILAATFVLLTAAVFAISASADTKPVITQKNVAYQGDFALMYAVDASTAKAPVTLYLYNEYPDADTPYANKYTTSTVTAASGNLEEDSYVFTTAGVSAKDMTDVFYVKAVDADNKESEVVKYSVAEYLYDRLATNGITQAQRELYESVIVMGTKAQAVLAPTTTPISNYRLVTVTGGTIDGFAQGVYPVGALLTPVSTDGAVSAWTIVTYDEAGNATASTFNGTLTETFIKAEIVAGAKRVNKPGTWDFEDANPSSYNFRDFNHDQETYNGHPVLFYSNTYAVRANTQILTDKVYGSDSIVAKIPFTAGNIGIRPICSDVAMEDAVAYELSFDLKIEVSDDDLATLDGELQFTLRFNEQASSNKNGQIHIFRNSDGTIKIMSNANTTALNTTALISEYNHFRFVVLPKNADSLTPVQVYINNDTDTPDIVYNLRDVHSFNPSDLKSMSFNIGNTTKKEVFYFDNVYSSYIAAEN